MSEHTAARQTAMTGDGLAAAPVRAIAAAEGDSLGVLSADGAASESDKRWYAEARLGLFLHWGMLTGEHEQDPFGPQMRYPYRTTAQFEAAAAAAGWRAERWIDEAKRLGATYVTIAAFHCELGYLKLWPSRIPGSPHTQRDFLAELLAAAAAEDIRIVVYINRDPKHASHDGIDWLDREAYRAHTGDPEADIASREGYLAYSLEVMEELIDGYPAIAGFWFDGYHEPQEAQQVFARLHARRPELVLINNNFGLGPVPDEDAMGLEDFGKRCEPEYDPTSGCWIEAGRHEYAFKVKWDWIYVGEGRPEWKNYALNYEAVPDNQTVLKRIVTVLANDWRANLGYGPRIGGEFPPLLREFTAHVADFWSWAATSLLHGAIGGGRGSGGFPPGYWSDGAYGVTTMRPDGQTHDLHVLTAPSGRRLAVPDAGYTVLSACDLRTGESIPYRQRAGLLELEPLSWDATETIGDTVIRLTTASQRRIVPHGPVTAAPDVVRALQASAAEHAAGSWLTVEAAPEGEREERAGMSGADSDRTDERIGEAEVNGAAQLEQGEPGEEDRLSALYEGVPSAARCDGETAWPCRLTIPLTERAVVEGLALLQPERGAVVDGGYAAPPGERIRRCAVYAWIADAPTAGALEESSMTAGAGETAEIAMPTRPGQSGEPVGASGPAGGWRLLCETTLRNQRGQQVLLLPAVETDALLLELRDNYSGTNRIGLRELLVLGRAGDAAAHS